MQSAWPRQIKLLDWVKFSLPHHKAAVTPAGTAALCTPDSQSEGGRSGTPPAHMSITAPTRPE